MIVREETVLPVVGPAVLVLLPAEVLPARQGCDPVLVPAHLVHLAYLVRVHPAHRVLVPSGASIAASSAVPG
jgi:hypothetical protein